jgi:hypothetical protein
MFDQLAPAVALARPIVERVVWCTVATAGPEGARSRIMHPVWSWEGQPTAVVSSRETPLKRRHLDHVPAVSCTWWDPSHDTVTIDARAEWVPEGERALAWERVASVPAPVGFDPSMIWPDGPLSPDCAFLRLTAFRIVVAPGGVPAARWTAPS